MIKELVSENCPSWFLIQEETSTSINGEASIELEGSDNLSLYSLEISVQDMEVEVKESVIGAKLPSFCPERHINYGGAFCIGFNIGKNINNTDDAKYWWESLHKHLKIQCVAAKTGVWPNQHSLSHGNAAIYQIKAERIATELCIYDQYQKAMFNSDSWFSKLVDDAHYLGVNALELDQLLDKFKFNKACYRRKRQKVKIVRKIISLELMRRNEEQLFWKSFDKSQVACCKTMKSCQLKSS